MFVHLIHLLLLILLLNLFTYLILLIYLFLHSLTSPSFAFCFSSQMFYSPFHILYSSHFFFFFLLLSSDLVLSCLVLCSLFQCSLVYSRLIDVYQLPLLPPHLILLHPHFSPLIQMFMICEVSNNNNAHRISHSVILFSQLIKTSYHHSIS